MKKTFLILSTLIFGLALFGQEQVMYSGQTAVNMISDVNDKFDAHSDSLAWIADTTVELRTDIQANAGLIGGKNLGAGVTTAAAPQDGFSIVWDNTANEYTLSNISGGGGDVSGVAGSGLTYANDSINLGGTASGNVYIYGASGTHNLRLGETNNYFGTVEIQGETSTQIGVANGDDVAGITITPTSLNVNSGNSTGLVYDGNYTTNTLAVANGRGVPDVSMVQSVIADTMVNYLKASNLSPAASDLWFTSDTIVLGSFSKDTTRTTDFYGSFYNDGSDTLVVTSMTAVLQGTSPSVAVDVQWHATFNSGSAVHLNTTPPTITSTTTGDSDTTFDNAQIPPGVWVWMETPTVTTPATYISVSLSGYRLNRAY